MKLRDYKSIFLNKSSINQLESFLENIVEAEFETIKFSQELYYINALDITEENIRKIDEFTYILARNEDN